MVSLASWSAGQAVPGLVDRLADRRVIDALPGHGDRPGVEVDRHLPDTGNLADLRGDRLDAVTAGHPVDRVAPSASGPHQPAHRRGRLGDLLLRVRTVGGDRVGHAVMQVVLKQVERHRLQRLGRRGDLGQHVDAVRVVLDHPLQTADLPLDPAQPVLGRRPGVLEVRANPVAQTATVVFDPARTSVAELAGWVRDCGFHCRGQSVPEHVCDPLAEPAAESAGVAERAGHAEQMAAAERAGTPGERMAAPHEVMGHGGHGAMSMAAMVADMRNRFLVAALFSIPILLWSPIGRDVLGFDVAAPFELRDDVFGLILSLPVIFYSAWIFFDGAVRALAARTLDMMVLVAVAVGAGWLYSLGVTLSGGGEVFYEAASVLAAFVLLGHWFEMRARGGANDAIHALLELAPAKAVV